MSNKRFIACVVAAVVTLNAALSTRAAGETDAKDAGTKRKELREKLKNMAPEERALAIKKWRDEHPRSAARQEEFRKRREELKNLTPEQSDARRKEMSARMEKRFAELKKKQADGVITDQEKQRLQRMERFMNNGRRRPQPVGSPGEEPSKDKTPAEGPASKK